MADEKPKKPRKLERAVALEYGKDDAVPRIVASGAGELARRIREFAEQHNIPIKEDETLTEMLAKIDTGANISPESYRLVAEVISFLYHTDRAWREKHLHVGEIMKTKDEET